MKIDPSTLKITDVRFAEIDGAPKRCTLVKLYTRKKQPPRTDQTPVPGQVGIDIFRTFQF